MLKKIILVILFLMLLYKFYPDISAFIDDIWVSGRVPDETHTPKKVDDEWVDNPMGVKERLNKSRNDRYGNPEGESE